MLLSKIEGKEDREIKLFIYENGKRAIIPGKWPEIMAFAGRSLDEGDVSELRIIKGVEDVPMDPGILQDAIGELWAGIMILQEADQMNQGAPDESAYLRVIHILKKVCKVLEDMQEEEQAVQAIMQKYE